MRSQMKIQRPELCPRRVAESENPRRNCRISIALEQTEGQSRTHEGIQYDVSVGFLKWLV